MNFFTWCGGAKKISISWNWSTLSWWDSTKDKQTLSITQSARKVFAIILEGSLMHSWTFSSGLKKNHFIWRLKPWSFSTALEDGKLCKCGGGPSPSKEDKPFLIVSWKNSISCSPPQESLCSNWENWHWRCRDRFLLLLKTKGHILYKALSTAKKGREEKPLLQLRSSPESQGQ